MRPPRKRRPSLDSRSHGPRHSSGLSWGSATSSVTSIDVSCTTSHECKWNGTDLPCLDEKQYSAFQALKRALMSPPALALPRSNLNFTVDTDACDY